MIHHMKQVLIELEDDIAANQPDSAADAYVDASVWEPKPARRRRRK
jgi:hypothetical protein